MAKGFRYIKKTTLSDYIKKNSGAVGSVVADDATFDRDIATEGSARWNFTKTAFAVAGNNNMVALATIIGNRISTDPVTGWTLATNGREWELYLGGFQALNNGEGGSSAGSPTYTTFSANELQGGFIQAGHSSANEAGKYPMEFTNLPPGTYNLYLIGSIKSSVNANVPNGVFKVKFGASAEQSQTILQQSNYTTPALLFTGTIAEGEKIQFGAFTLTEGNGDAALMNALLIESVTAGSQDLETPFVSSTFTIYAPTLTQVPPQQTVSPPFVSSTFQAFAPTITAGSVTITAPLVASTFAIYLPTITAGAVTVQPPVVPSTFQVFLPTVSVGAVTLSQPFLTSTLQIFTPTVSAGAVQISAPFVDSTFQAFTPTVTPGSVTLIQPFISSTFQPFLPEIEVGGQLSTPFIFSTFQAFPPTVIPGEVTISPGFLESTFQIYPPEVMVGGVTLTQPLLESTFQIFPPAVIRGLSLFNIMISGQFLPAEAKIRLAGSWSDTEVYLKRNNTFQKISQ